MISKLAVAFSLAYAATISAQHNVHEGPSSHIPPIIDQTMHQVHHCPEGYIQIGKECAKTVTQAPDITCAHKSHLIDGKCVTYTGKESQCPIGYSPTEGLCKKTVKAAPEIVCPKNFVLRSKDFCVTTVSLPGKKVCPAGTIPKGDKCAIYKTEVPKYVCPKEYELKANVCIFEEKFDCTPQREFKEVSIKKPEKLITPAPGKGENIYELPASKPVVEEYIISKTCKRITSEPARPICTTGIFDGKMCKYDVITEPVIKPGGFEEKVIKASTICPEHYTFSEEHEDCFMEREVLPEFYCPSGTVDLETKCGLYSLPKLVCPEGFYLNGKNCLKTVYTKPHVEVTITYSCKGKDCKNENKDKEAN